MRRILWGLSACLPAFRGKQRLFQLLARPSRSSGIVVHRQGAAFRLHGHDLNEWYVATQRWHSSEVSECLDRLAGHAHSGVPAVLWDIGSNIGAVAIPFLRRHPSARAVCFEPSPEVAGRLIGNLNLNPSVRSRADVVIAPLCEFDGPVGFFASAEPLNSGMGGLGPSDGRTRAPIRSIGVRGDMAVSLWGLPYPTVVKIDVEGFELEVLRGMQGVLQERQPSVVFEHSLHRIGEREGHSVTTVCDFLRSLGYEIYSLRGGGPIAESDLGHDCDLLAVWPR